jgi:hypothetical protein
MCLVSVAKPQDGPTTPVPPVPTPYQLYQSYLLQLLDLERTIDMWKADRAVYQLLYALTPTPQIAAIIADYNQRIFIAEIEAQILRDKMLALGI